MAEYLLEVRFQEMPSRYLSKLLKQLTTRLFEDLMGRGLGPIEVTTGMTPRRLMVCFRDLPEVSAKREAREVGPSVADAYDAQGAATEALMGFADRVGAELSDLQEIKTERGVYVGYVHQVEGRPLSKVLAELVPGILAELPWWPAIRESGGPTGVMSVLDGGVVPFEFQNAVAGSTSVGHPILSPDSFEVTSLEDYLGKLRQLGIEVIVEDRRRVLEAALGTIAKEFGGSLEGDAGLLDRLTAACEIPGVVHGDIDLDHLRLPEEIVLAALGRRLDCFALRGPEGLLPVFLTVMDRADDPMGYVRAGHQRAVHGCLVDARFSYDVDHRQTLAERLRQLVDHDVHPGLGSYAAKAERTRALVELACDELGWHEVLEPAREAAGLLKADLATAVVRTFPSLRGTIGGIYAREEGYVEAVWQSIYEHYTVRPIPSERVGQVVAIADRLDSLVGFLSVDQVPSGSRDPFGLRRLTQGLLRIVADADIELDLDLMAARAVLLFGDSLDRGAELLVGELQSFLADRTRHLLGRRGFAYDEIEAAEAVGARNLPDLVARLKALQTVREEPEFRSLVLSAKRISNIVQDAPEFELRAQELAPGAELELHEALNRVREAVDRAAKERRYEDCLRSMVELVPNLDRFFSDVLVMDENDKIRENRIALLQACRRVIWRIARLKEMTVDKSEPATKVD